MLCSGYCRLLQNVEHFDCLVLLPTLFPGHFLNEAIRFEVDDDRLLEWDEFQELAADYEVPLS
jgi:hypothetical protein